MFPIEFFWRAADRHPTRPAVLAPGVEVSFAALARRVAAVAHGILQRDPAPGGRVAVGGSNSVEHLVAILGTLAAGKTWVPLNPRNGTPELERMVDFTEPSLLLLDAALAARIGGPARAIVALHGEEPASLSRWEQEFGGVPRPVFEASLDDTQAIKFTGGTTGLPKGVMQPYRAWNTTIVSQWHAFGFHASDRFLACAPLTHGASTYILPFLGVGGGFVFPPDAKAATILDAIERQRVTTSFMPPTLIYAVMEEQRQRPRDVTSLRRLIYGAAPMPPDKIRAAQALFGPVLCATFGQTESPQIIACLRPEEMAESANLTSVGRPSLMTEVRVMSSDGRLLTAGEEGEVVVRGDLVMSGYWRMPEETQATLRGGWLHTGDIGVFDERGYLFLKDRARDVIITGGFNVYPSDVEAVVGRHPAVFDCVVVGVPDEKWGEAVHAAVQLCPGRDVGSEELTLLVKNELGSVKAPKAVHIFETLPKSAVGKNLKSEVRREILARRIAIVDTDNQEHP